MPYWYRDSTQDKSAKDAKAFIVANASPEVLEAFAVLVENAEVKGDWCYRGPEVGSVFEDNVSDTLQSLAADIRSLKRP